MRKVARSPFRCTNICICTWKQTFLCKTEAYSLQLLLKLSPYFCSDIIFMQFSSSFSLFSLNSNSLYLICKNSVKRQRCQLVKFSWCNGSDNRAMFSQSSQPGSNSLLIVSTHPHEGDGCVCVCGARYLLLMKATWAETHAERRLTCAHFLHPHLCTKLWHTFPLTLRCFGL